jgi:hypothetical protein
MSVPKICKTRTGTVLIYFQNQNQRFFTKLKNSPTLVSTMVLPVSVGAVSPKAIHSYPRAQEEDP